MPTLSQMERTFAKLQDEFNDVKVEEAELARRETEIIRQRATLANKARQIQQNIRKYSSLIREAQRAGAAPAKALKSMETIDAMKTILERIASGQRWSK